MGDDESENTGDCVALTLGDEETDASDAEASDETEGELLAEMDASDAEGSEL